MENPRLQHEGELGPPEDGWVFRKWQLAFVPLQGWVPPELATEPAVPFPLPYPDRPLSLAEKYVAAAALYDVFWIGDTIGEDSGNYTSLLNRARRILPRDKEPSKD